ncbi:argininosuccinate synthase-like protein [Streptococcus ictaluri 707-05]|uniref:argininosuccinate synthase n=1 Tax=Streptococcus ictaluri 707-05 TaxID=764299 RepID=G5K591_9STRE|nr:argininosuccinate synthase-like protein [Streptococcus ictaluri 707-05]
MWGRANECGVLENPWHQAPEEAYDITVSPEETPNKAEYLDIHFEKGVPVALNGEAMALSDLILTVNKIAGAHGVGRIDHVENRLVGIKSREIYECPGAVTLLAAHKDIEDLTLVRELSHFKPIIENELSQLIYNGLWFNPATQALMAYIKATQEQVNGITKVKLYKGQAQVVARRSDNSLYDEKLATYTAADSFDQEAAIGFIKLWGLPTQVNAQVNKTQLQ